MNGLLHGHHKDLISWGRGYQERLDQIHRIKDRSEWAVREKRMHQLTEEEIAALPPEVIAAGRAYENAWDACETARHAYDRAMSVYEKARCASAARAYDEARWRFDEAGHACVAAMRAHDKEVEAWHRRVCSQDCLATVANDWNIFG